MRALLLDAADGEYAAPAALGHRRDEGLEQFERGAEIDGDLAVEVLAGDGPEILRQFDRGVQHQDVDRRPGGDRGGEMAAGIVVGKILGEGLRLAAARVDFADHGGGVAGFLVGPGVVDGEARACAGEAERDDATNLAAGAGDKGGAAGKAECSKGIGHEGDCHGRRAPRQGGGERGKRNPVTIVTPIVAAPGTRCCPSPTTGATDMTTNSTDTQDHRVVSREDWLTERTTLLAREKELTRLRDQIARERRALPWVRIDKNYVFDTPEGKHPLAGLFDGRRQLLVQHFMFGPGWEQGCPSCSYMADHSDGMGVHLAHRDVTLVAVSRAPLDKIERFRERMGWKFKWVSSHDSDFNYDFGVSFTPEDVAKGEITYNFGRRSFAIEELPGVSVFFKNDAGEVFHTYSTYGRGVEVMMGTYNMLDLVPKGRDERDSGHKMEWVRHHDRY